MNLPVVRWTTDTSYAEAAARQEELVLQGQETIVLCEHPATITLGSASEPGDLHLAPVYYERMGIEVYKSPRGGRATYHGPGQLVCYPILNLRQRNMTIHAWLHFLEVLMLRLCAFYGISAHQVDGKTGAWIGYRKIGFIGVRVKRGFCYHGCSINVLPQTKAFQLIVPCGMPQLQVTSIHEECGQTPTIWDAADIIETYLMESLREPDFRTRIA